MRKLMYLLIGAASVVIYRAIVAGREETEGTLPRPVPKTFDGGRSVEDEIAGPVGEV